MLESERERDGEVLRRVNRGRERGEVTKEWWERGQGGMDEDTMG